MRAINFGILLATLFCCSHSPENQSQQSSCEWCGANEAPEDARSSTTIADSNEAGERIKIGGTVFKADGVTPAKNVVMYLYHTNAEGIYPKKGNESGNGKRHGYLRGWIKTGENGKYVFETIKPAAYPGRTEPAHIHLTIKESNKDEYWLKSFLFEDDPLLTSKDRYDGNGKDHFNHVIRLKKKDSLLVGTRDILLKN